MDEHDTDTARCVACHRRLHGTEASRWACSGCQQTAGEELAAIPRLHATALTRAAEEARHAIGSNWGAGAGGRSTPGPRVLADLTAVDGGPAAGVIAELVSCVRDWVATAAEGGLRLDHPDWPAGDRARVETLCRWLRWHLDWACGMHPGAGDSLHGIRSVHRRLARAAGLAERPVRLACPCGAVIEWRASTSAHRCAGCGTRYSREQAAALPRAPRSRTAAAA